VEGAAVRLRKELDLAATADRTWAVLLDLPRMARALPEATLEPDAVGGSYRGTLLRYAGTATLQDVDEDERVVSYYLQGHENGGPGTAAATVAMRLQGRDGCTRLIVEAEVAVAGGPSEDAASAVLAEFVRGLELELDGATRQAALDTGAAAVAIGERVLLVLAGIAAGFAFGRLFGRRR
jgi:carbon monoxide dehydrogenase subunit G